MKVRAEARIEETLKYVYNYYVNIQTLILGADDQHIRSQSSYSCYRTSLRQFLRAVRTHRLSEFTQVLHVSLFHENRDEIGQSNVATLRCITWSRQRPDFIKAFQKHWSKWLRVLHEAEGRRSCPARVRWARLGWLDVEGGMEQGCTYCPEGNIYCPPGKKPGSRLQKQEQK